MTLLSFHTWAMLHPTLFMMLAGLSLGLTCAILTTFVLIYEVVIRPSLWLMGKTILVPVFIGAFLLTLLFM